jgi:chemotaxis protein methyltransferase CheR
MAGTDLEYGSLREAVRERSAGLIDPSRNELFDTRFAPVARRMGAASLKDFVSVLKVAKKPPLHRAVAEAMTIHETGFFRDKQAFEMLRETILPRLIARRGKERRLRVWSAGCSSGQEAYSVGMLLCEHFPELAEWDVKIFGSDHSGAVIELAKAGRFRRMEVNRGLPVRMLLKYFVRDGDEWEVVPAVRTMCEFDHANLCGTLPELPLFDLVLLRNVLLYFSRPDRGRVLGAVHRRMKPDGCLMLGSGEQAEDSTRLFEVEAGSGGYVYRSADGV